MPATVGSRIPPGRLLLLVALVAFLPHLPALFCGFAFDDAELIRNNPAVLASSPELAWSSPYWPGREVAGLYRPWTTASYWLDRTLFGLNPAAFHLTNLLLHVAVTLVVLTILGLLLPTRRGLTLGTALLFAVHPIHTEAVVGIVGRAELWAALGALGAYLALLLALGQTARRALWLSLSTIAFAIGLLSKESAIGIFGLLLLHLVLGPTRTLLGAEDVAGTRRTLQRALALWSIPIGLSFLLRLRVIGSLFGLTHVNGMDNILTEVGAFDRIVTALGLQWLVVWRYLVPVTLSADYSFQQLTVTAGWKAGGAAFAALVALLAWIGLRRGDRVVVWGGGLAVATGLLTSNLPMAIGTIMGERLAYLPSVGSFLLLVHAATHLPLPAALRTPRAAWSLAAAPLLLLSARTAIRCPDWNDDLSLFRATAEASPRSGKARANHAVALIRAERYPEALEEALAAARTAPNYPAAEGAVGTALFRLGRAREALPHLRRAAFNPPVARKNLEALLELGNAQVSLSAGAAAESVFAVALAVAPGSDSRPWIGRASSLALQSRWPESSATWNRAVRLAPTDPAVRRQWAYALWQAGRIDSSEAIYLRLSGEAPADPDVLNDTAWFLAHTGRQPSLAVHLARRAFRARPDPNTADTLLETLLQSAGPETARAWVDSLRASGGHPALIEALAARLAAEAGRR
ncbi:MAG: tetratricopeptide repeat protein [Candidatus Eisenbacteria bacterium]|nr:tetratricopeptide repeat protein [Candidatus Eisenbacteria bacterium]